MDDRKMGCMSGFLQLFERHHILASKRLYTTKRLPPFTEVNDTLEPKNIAVSQEIAKERVKGHPAKVVAAPSPERLKECAFVPTKTPPKSPLPLPIFEVKDGGARSSWKIRKEAPRLSLDSRATVDAKGSLHPKEIQINASSISANHCENAKDGVLADNEKQHRCPSVIAKLMGLEALPQSSSETTQKAELRRSASESRVSRDLFHSHFIEGNRFEFNEPNYLHPNIPNCGMAENAEIDFERSMLNARHRGQVGSGLGIEKSERPKGSSRGLSSTSWKPPQHRKSFFDTAEIFPEPKQTVPLHGEIDKRLRIRGLDEPSKDLETLKQILEALQLKGLLHTKRPSEQLNRLNVIYDPSFSFDESQIVVMKPSRSTSPINRKYRNESQIGVSQKSNHSNESLPSVSPYWERSTDRNAHSPLRTTGSTSPNRRDGCVRHSNPVMQSKTLNVDPQRRASESIECQKPSPLQSPKVISRRNSSEQNFTKRSWNKKSQAHVHQKEKITNFVADDDQSSSSISESSLTMSFPTKGEGSNTEEYNEGRNLLERCDKLIHSIAEMTATDMQPSPVSVLDSSFYREDSPSPSPIRKRSIEFLGDFDNEIPRAEISPVQAKSKDTTVDCDISYITDILRASHYLPEESDTFLLLEKQQFLKGKDTSEDSRLQRKLIFDTITEILDRNRQLPPWKRYSCLNSITAQSSVQIILSEFLRIQERENSDDLFEIICNALKKDLAHDDVNGWGDCPIEMSETVLDMERLIYKDLMGETIRELASFVRRKLVF
ncbi:PREDICTED: protein LONGIFOLIA 1-like [Ipomoea nil]|uniref:protein LONGIFOLIA 1-like n=1 Tax=Ipomoea nil TaxID=35883 RepID=UPI000900CD15|nr:PREDICTED: protein LONGIFOLIA 1-like [Ipomoea nil]XP_019178069.1 PREDICTED: protein LONGIFOLIA 1-like [Ipomoea nil]